MTPYEDFENSISSTRNLIEMYFELRQSRGLSRRGKLSPGDEDLFWLPRSAVVAAISSLDAYVHAVLYDRIPHALKSDHIPDALCGTLAELIPIKDSNSFRRIVPIISSRNFHDELTKIIKENRLSFQSFQFPDKILGAYRLIGFSDIFLLVSQLWPGPATTDEDIKRFLANYVKRRNQIAHEGDREASGSVRPIQALYAQKCADFVENLTWRLDSIVYEHDS